jgi:hypothetical protein
VRPATNSPWTFNNDDTAKGTNYATESNGNFVTMTAMAALPESESAVLGSLGLLALLRRRRS